MPFNTISHQQSQIVRNDYLNQQYFIRKARLMAQNPSMLLKIVFTGDSGVGKTSLLRRQTECIFENQHLASIGVDFKIKTYQVGKISAKVQLWDTAGQQRFRSIQKPYYRNSNVICLCFNLNDRTSFVNLAFWLDQLKSFDVQGQIYLIGCKSDLDAVVPTDQILTFAEAYKVSYMQTSAKQDVGITDGFRKIIEEAVQANLINLAFNKKPQQLEGVKSKQSNSMGPKKSCGCGNS